MWILTYIKNNNVQILCKRSTVQLLQLEKKRFEATGKYRSGKIEVRTEEGFKHTKQLSWKLSQDKMF